MAEKIAKIKNVSRADFSLNLSYVTKDRVLLLKPDVAVPVTHDEYSYLVSQCPGAFEKGFLKVIDADKTIVDEVIESENVMTEEEIDALMELTPAKLKTKLKGFTSQALVKDIRRRAVELNKSDRFITEIDTKLADLSEGSILL